MRKSGKYTFKNIEDPIVLAVVRELSDRWPKIGAAADHPLTEYFIRRRGRPGYLVPLINNLRWIIVSSMAFFYLADWPKDLVTRFNMGHTWLSIIFIILAVYGLVYFATWRPQHIRAMSSPEQLISKNTEQNCWIWLSGLRFRDFLGILTGYYYWLGSGLYRVRYAICAGFVAVDAALIWVLYACGAEAAWKINAIQMIPLGIAVIFLMADPAIQALGSLRQAGWLTNDGHRAIDLLVYICFIFSSVVLSLAHTHPILSLCITPLLTAMIVLSHLALADELRRYFVSLLKTRNKFIKLLAPEYNEDSK